MLINKKHIIFLAVMLVAMMSVAVAADVNDSNTESTTPAITHTTDNNYVQTATHPSNEITKKTDNKIENKTNNEENTRCAVININNDNFDDYVTSTGLTSLVNGNDTLNFTTSVTRTLHNYTINKPVNIEGNGFTLDLNTIYGYNLPSLQQTKIEFNSGASNSNITNLKFHNTQVFTTTASNITFDNINVTVDQGVGMSTGYFAMRNGVINITVKNSYFHAINNTGCSAIVITLGENCTIDNNTVIGEGTVGNLIYLNRWGAVGNANGITQNKNNIISNNTIFGPETPINTCIGIVNGGPHNHIINNTINYSGKGINGNWAGTYDPTTNTTNDYYNDTYIGNAYINNTLNNGAEFSGAQDSFIAGNTFTGTATIAKNSNVKYNIFENTATINQYSNITNNIFKSDVTLNNNINFKNNNAENSTVYVNGANCDFCNNVIKVLNVGSSATNTRVCWDNTINTIINPYNNVERYLHPVSLNFNKKKNLSVKGEGEPLIVDVTEENFSTYFTPNRNIPTWYELNYSSDITINLYYVPSNATKIVFDFNGRNLCVVSVIGKNDLTLRNVVLSATNIFLTISDIKLIYDENFNKSEGSQVSLGNVRYNGNQYVTLNNITIDSKVDYSNDIMRPVLILTRQKGNHIVIKNSVINITAPSMDGTYEVISVREANTQLINNTINIQENYGVGDSPSLAAIGVDNEAYLSSNYIFENNNITITGAEGSNSKLYAVKLVTNDTQIKNNKIIINSDTSDSAIELTGNNNTVTGNYIVVNDKTGDSAVTTTGENNIVENNAPLTTSLKVIAPATANINETTPITILLKDNTGKLIPEQEVKVTVGDNQTETVTTDEDGIAVYNLTATTSGELNLTITYEAQGAYTGSNTTVTINVNEDKDAIIEELNNTIK